MYERHHLQILKSRMAEPRRTMHVVMGPRQVGKSTMIGQFIKSTSVPCDLHSADGVGKTNLAWISERWHESRMKMTIHNESERILIFDEIQKINGWSEVVKAEWDRDTREKCNLKVILLGSSKLLLQKGLEESLAGRFETIKMGYWEWKEMHEAFDLSMEQFIFFGGFPGLVPYIDDEARWRNMMEDSIISPVLNKDIMEIEEIRNPALFRQIFEIASRYSAKELSLTKMQGVVNSGTVPTIGSYLDIMDKTMMSKPLHKYEPSKVKEKNSVPKLQTYNNAFRNRYGFKSFEESLLDRTEWGRQVESAVGAYLAGRSFIDDFELNYWRNNKKEEVDYILRKEERIVAIEVKSSSLDETAGFEHFKSQYGKHISCALIVGPEGLPLEDFFSINIRELFKRNSY